MHDQKIGNRKSKADWISLFALVAFCQSATVHLQWRNPKEPFQQTKRPRAHDTHHRRSNQQLNDCDSHSWLRFMFKGINETSIGDAHSRCQTKDNWLVPPALKLRAHSSKWCTAATSSGQQEILETSRKHYSNPSFTPKGVHKTLPAQHQGKHLAIARLIYLEEPRSMTRICICST